MKTEGVIFYDLETTDANTERCKIIEMCFATREGILLHEFVNPGIPISKQASDVHGITAEDVRGALPFADHAVTVQQIIDGAACLVGYNNYQFDSVVLDRELTDAGMPGFAKDQHGVVVQPEADLFTMWQRHEKRDLSTAALRFAGVDLVNAHSAGADTEVLPLILDGMRKTFDLESVGIIESSQPEGAVDREGKFRRREDGTIVFNFGKHKNEPVTRGHPYLKWMIGASFSPEVKAWCRRML